MSTHSKAEECRKNAENCDDLARRAANDSAAGEFRKLAREWRELAEQIEKSKF